jgi:hypothetical protein
MRRTGLRADTDERKPEWIRLVLLNWPRASWALYDYELAADEIRTVMGRNAATNEELCDTIRWMAGPEGKQNSAPSLRELIRAVYMRRQAARGEGPDSGPAMACALCTGGWGTEWPAGSEVGFGSGIAIPCMCSAGARLMQVVKRYSRLTGDELDGFTRRRRAAVAVAGQREGRA